MLLHALVSRELGEVIEFYADANDAAAALEELLIDEPLWHEELVLVAVKLPDATAAALSLRTPAAPVLGSRHSSRAVRLTVDRHAALGARWTTRRKSRGVEPESASQ